MDTKVEPPLDFLATNTAASVGRCYPTLMSRAISRNIKPGSPGASDGLKDVARMSVGFSGKFPVNFLFVISCYSGKGKNEKETNC